MRPGPIQIIGGGLAGLSLGILLRQRGVPVSIWEAGDYPRHRVCGEVLSGEGPNVLERLGLERTTLDHAGTWTQSAGFFLQDHVLRQFRLPKPALCISRYSLDALLARRFIALGGDLRTKARWPDNASAREPGVVRATGRARCASDSGWRWLGLKAHARNVRMHQDVEMHFLKDGYVGLCQLTGGAVNVCGLFRRRVQTRGSSASWRTTLQGPPASTLHERLVAAEWDEASVCGVAALSVRPHRGCGGRDCRIGDALTMISPLTGNGMSMALQAAETGGPWIEGYSKGTLTWDEARDGLADALDSLFRQRLWWGWRLHQSVFSRVGQVAVMAGLRCPWIWRGLVAATR